MYKYIYICISCTYTDTYINVYHMYINIHTYIYQSQLFYWIDQKYSIFFKITQDVREVSA